MNNCSRKFCIKSLFFIEEMNEKLQMQTCRFRLFNVYFPCFMKQNKWYSFLKIKTINIFGKRKHFIFFSIPCLSLLTNKKYKNYKILKIWTLYYQYINGFKINTETVNNLYRSFRNTHLLKHTLGKNCIWENKCPN